MGPRINNETLALIAKIKALQQQPDPLHDHDEIQEQLKLFVQEWKHETIKEREELEKLRNRVISRRAIRAQEEIQLEEMKQREEQLRIQFIEEEKERKHQEKLERLEQAEKKRQKLIEEENKKRTFIINKTPAIASVTKQENREPTPEELKIMKDAAMSIRIKKLEIEGLGKERLKRKCGELWERLIQLETERYDLEELFKRQEYDFKELKERQKQQLRHKAMKLGLPEEALTGKYPPKIMVASKYERRLGLKPFGETKELFEGGFVKAYREEKNKVWENRQDLFTKGGAVSSGEIPPWLEEVRGGRRRIEEEEEKAKAVVEEQEQVQEEETKEEPEKEESEVTEEEEEEETEEEVEETEEEEEEEESDEE